MTDNRCDDPNGCADDVAIVCTLESGDVDARLAAWRALMLHADRVDDIEGGVRIRFDESARAGEVADLAAAEHACCAFLWFAVVVDGAGVALDVHGPAGARPVIDALIATT
ncbi:MAG: transcriptional regulator, MerR family [Actinomycetia bacterium]|nr:transcriptional regulator, MerR family [Actinomycetes bacterium]